MSENKLKYLEMEDEKQKYNGVDSFNVSSSKQRPVSLLIHASSEKATRATVF
jgi:hypothetical protein